VRLLAAASVLLGGCAPALQPMPEATPATAPAPSAPPVERAPTRVRLAPQHDTARYDVVNTTDLMRDSAGTLLEEQVTLRAIVSLALTRGREVAQLTGTGRVDSFVVEATSRVAGANASVLPGVVAGPPTPSLPLTVPFDAMLDGLSARVVPRPALANECDRPEISAVALARSLLVRFPDELVVGASWGDTARVFMCRSGIPITVQTISIGTVDSLVDGPDGAATRAAISRALTTRVEGTLSTGWRTVGLTGEGTGTQQILLDAASGMLAALDEEGELSLRVRDSARPDNGAQTVTQHVALRVRRRVPLSP
jgi:hypothetical protein